MRENHIGLRKSIGIVFTMGIISFYGLSDDNVKREVDPRAWTELDIIPMPKQVQLTDKDLELTPENVTLIVGKDKCRQSEIGAEWINKRITDIGGKSLPIFSGNAPEATGVRIIIGTRDDNPFIKEAIEQKLLNVGDRNPGERGYEIRRSRDASCIYLAGADPIGTLYACVTFGELLARRSEKVLWRAAEVRDWPDTIYMQMGDDGVGVMATPEIYGLISSPDKDAYMKASRVIYDQLLRWKITSLGYNKSFLAQSDDKIAIIREGIEYGKIRGVAATIYTLDPFVGSKKDYPELWEKMPEPFKIMDQVRSWGMDDVRRKTAEKIAAQVAKMGITYIGLHDADIGGYDNPTQWNDRSLEDRARWGDNYAGAVANKLRVYYDALRRASPDIRVLFSQYPYNITILDPDYAKDKYTIQRYGENAEKKVDELRSICVRFWKGLHEYLPEDVNLSIREAPYTPVKIFREDIIPGRGVFTWLSLAGSITYRPFLSEGVCWVGTFCWNPRDFIYLRNGDVAIPFNSLGVREYSWNMNTPGATRYNNHVPVKSELYTVILPRIVRNLFGREAAPEIIQAITPRNGKSQSSWWNTSLQPPQIFLPEDSLAPLDRRIKTYCETSADMAWQAQMAREGAEKLDNVWEKCLSSGTKLGMSDYAFRRFIILRENFHVCRWLGEIRTQEFIADELAAQNPEAAMKALEKGLALLSEAKKALRTLVDERLGDPILQHAGSREWRTFMADQTRFEGPENRLEKRKLKISGRPFVPAAIMSEMLRENQSVTAIFTDTTPLIDGKLEEADWKAAFPAETFIVDGKKTCLPLAFTRVQTLFNQDALFFGVTCYAARHETVVDSDAIELTIAVTGVKENSVSIRVLADGKVERLGVAPEEKQDIAWLKVLVNREERRWTAEVRVNWGAFNREGKIGVPPADAWKTRIIRKAVLKNGIESSSIPASSDENVAENSPLAALVFEREKRFCLSTDVKTGKQIQGIMLLQDGMVTMGVLDELDITSNSILHNVRLAAIGRNEKGEVKSAPSEWLKADAIYREYHGAGNDRLQVVFDSFVPNAQIELILSAEEGTFSKTIKLK